VDDGAVLQRGADVVAVVGDVGDLGVEPVIGVFDGALDEDSGQFSAQNLQFRCGPVTLSRRGDWERRHGRTVGPHETRAHLPCVGGADVVVDTHPSDDIAGGSADIHVLAIVATRREALYDGGRPAARRELMSQRGSADACTGNDCVATHASRVTDALVATMKSSIRSTTREGASTCAK